MGWTGSQYAIVSSSVQPWAVGRKQPADGRPRQLSPGRAHRTFGDRMSRILVAGGAGFLGTNLVEEALRRGHAVTVLDRPGAPSDLPADARARLQWVEGDFRDPDAVCRACSGQDVAFHLIGTTLPKSSNEAP